MPCENDIEEAFKYDIYLTSIDIFKSITPKPWSDLSLVYSDGSISRGFGRSDMLSNLCILLNRVDRGCLKLLSHRAEKVPG